MKIMALVVLVFAFALGGCSTTKNYYIYEKGSSPAAEREKRKAAEREQTDFVWYKDDKGNNACVVFGVKVEDEKKCNEALLEYKMIAARARVSVPVAMPVYPSYYAAPAYVRGSSPFLQAFCGAGLGYAGSHLIGQGRGSILAGVFGGITGVVLCGGTEAYSGDAGYGYGYGYYGSYWNGGAFDPTPTPLSIRTEIIRRGVEERNRAFQNCGMMYGPFSPTCQRM